MDETLSQKSSTAAVHSWDAQARKIICGAPGQIGSTKHPRSVTCATCLELLGRPPRTALRVVPR